MFEYINKIVHIQKTTDKDSIVLRWRLLLYLAVVALTLLSCTILLLFSLDVFAPGDKVDADLNSHLERYEEHLATYFGNTAAQGIRLSTLAAKEVERTLAEHGAAFGDLSNNPRLITALERNTFDILRNALLITECSGAFIIFDATVNTSLPGSQDSRCGLYLKLANINVSKPVSPEILWTRGTHEVGLEFTTSRVPSYRMVLDKTSKNLIESYYYPPVIQLYGTWEHIMPLLVPIVGKSGKVYGVCGFEISSLFFKLTHPVAKSPYNLTGLIAPRRGESLLAGAGLESGEATGYFAGLGSGELRIGRAGGLTTFRLQDGREFVGVYKEIALSPLARSAGETWVAACFMPRGEYTNAMYANYLKFFLPCVVFFVIAGALCWSINRQCIAPLVAGIDAIKSGAAQKTNIHEIDDLLEFMAGNDSGKELSGSDVDISAFYSFKQNIDKLSRAEKGVFDLYMKGHSAQEIADLLYVSINTIKSHNKSIYRKLNVSSRKALMVYIQMMKRDQD